MLLVSDLHRIQARQSFRRGLDRMTGRDPNEEHRAATPLELLFDLAFVVAFGQAADQLAHAVAEGHVFAGIAGFAFAMFAIVWAWINFTWFASAYDTDDWFYRVTTMVQMIGVVILALGLPAVFASIEAGESLDNDIVVAGYVIMRVAMVAQWLRAAKQDPSRRRTALTFAVFIIIAQVGWVVLTILDVPLAVGFVAFPVLYFLELAIPIFAERKSSGTPWHPLHIAERYALLLIIALGEGVFGTVASVSALVESQGWSAEAVLVVVAGIGLTFGLWWNYFMLPAGPVLARYRGRGFVWGYGHILVYAAIAATGAGLHVAAFVIEGHTEVGTLGAIVAVAVPVLAYTIAIFSLYTYMVREADPFHLALFAGTLLMLALAIVLATNGASIGLCLVIVTLAPAITVVGYETIGHRHQASRMARLLG
jgi:low temperature requirement protein LtrA